MKTGFEFDSVKQFVLRHWVSCVAAQAFILLSLGFLVGGGFSGSRGDGLKGAAHGEHGEASSKWTCSMHPQIQKTGPGDCPVCGMDLIPVASQAGIKTSLRQLTVSREARELMDIQTTPVERRFVTAEIRMVGKVDYDETRVKHITARVPGRLDRLFVNFTGVQVKKGHHMVYMYSEQLYTAQQELIGAISSARSTKPNSFFETGIDLVESSREKLRLLGITPEQIAEIEKQIKPSDHMTIYSEIDGIVIQKLKQEGDRVDVGDRIYTVADLSQVWVMFDAYESDLPWLRYGQTVTFTTEAFPGERFEGKVAFIDPVLNAKTRTVRVRVNLPNLSGKLKPEMFVRAVVKSKVAAGGRVMDAALAGKWISPMHPEIIKDEPGNCDICGMPLVRAESLGYVAAEAGDAAKALVIPVSAALVTGKRAIVYVELPEMPPALEDRFNEVVESLGQEQVEHVQAAFAKFEAYVRKPNNRPVTAYARGLWEQLAGEVQAISVEGRTVKSLERAGELIETLTKKMNNLRAHFARPDQPTFHGREIVLGPRAGNYYLVRHGLDEGEIVVTNGSFKIDSALQIQASPSMMTPSSGGSGGHDHGGKGSQKTANNTQGHAASDGMQIPVKFSDGLLTLDMAVRQVADAMQTNDIDHIKGVFSSLRTALDDVEGSEVEGQAAMVWKELGMLIGNDIVEGSELTQLADARRVHSSLLNNIRQVRQQFGLSQRMQHRTYDVPAEFQLQLAGVWNSYLVVQKSLAGDQFAQAVAAVAQLDSAVKSTDMKLLTENSTHMAWMKELANLKKIIGLLKPSKDLTAMRAAFQSLSGEMFVLKRSFGFGPKAIVYQLHCPMAFGNKGANWLQGDKKVKNPYFGSTMLGCADRVELISEPMGGTRDEGRSRVEGRGSREKEE